MREHKKGKLILGKNNNLAVILENEEPLEIKKDEIIYIKNIFSINKNDDKSLKLYMDELSKNFLNEPYIYYLKGMVKSFSLEDNLNYCRNVDSYYNLDYFSNPEDVGSLNFIDSGPFIQIFVNDDISSLIMDKSLISDDAFDSDLSIINNLNLDKIYSISHFLNHNFPEYNLSSFKLYTDENEKLIFSFHDLNSNKELLIDSNTFNYIFNQFQKEYFLNSEFIDIPYIKDNNSEFNNFIQNNNNLDKIEQLFKFERDSQELNNSDNLTLNLAFMTDILDIADIVINTSNPFIVGVKLSGKIALSFAIDKISEEVENTLGIPSDISSEIITFTKDIVTGKIISEKIEDEIIANSLKDELLRMYNIPIYEDKKEDNMELGD